MKSLLTSNLGVMGAAKTDSSDKSSSSGWVVEAQAKMVESSFLSQTIIVGLSADLLSGRGGIGKDGRFNAPASIESTIVDTFVTSPFVSAGSEGVFNVG